MKIRIKGNTVRYRLIKPEVAELLKEGLLKEQTEFISGTLIYAIRQTMKDVLSADFNQNTITLNIPGKVLYNWANTEQVSIDCNLPLKNGNILYVLLEKDFKCTDADILEDQTDYFKNPHITC